MLEVSYFRTLMTLCSKPCQTSISQFIDIMTWQTCCCIFPICVINDAGDKWHIRLCMGIRVKV